MNKEGLQMDNKVKSQNNTEFLKGILFVKLSESLGKKCKK